MSQEELARLVATGNTSRILEALTGHRKLSRRALSAVPNPFPALYDMLEKRIQEFPSEAKGKDASGLLPIHRLLIEPSPPPRTHLFPLQNQPPESLIRTMIQAHPESVVEVDNSGDTPLHLAVYHSCTTVLSSPCIDLFSQALTIRNKDGRTAFHESLACGFRNLHLPLASCWSLLNAHPPSASIPLGDGRMPLEVLRTWFRFVSVPAKELLVKLALYYGAVPQVPSSTWEFENHPAIKEKTIANILPLPESDKDLLLKESLRAKCPWVLFDFLFTSFPEQRLPVDANTEQPRQGSTPFEMAIRNLAILEPPQQNDPEWEQSLKLEQLSMVYSLLRDNPMHYLRQIDGPDHRRVQEFEEYAQRHRHREQDE